MLSGMAKQALVPPQQHGPRRCPNCHAVATHDFCPRCGQSTRGLRASFRSLIGEFFSVWLGADAKIWPSLKLLLLHPGASSVEYREGRRARYIPPLRLYLVFSILFFLVLEIRGDAPNATFTTSPTAQSPQLEDAEVGSMEQSIRDSDFLREDSWWGGPLRTALLQRTHQLDRMSDRQRAEAISQQMWASLPVALFLVLPLLALYLRFLWMRTGRIYFDHFIFAIQFQSFLFALFLALILLPLPGWVLIPVILLYPPIYLTLAQHRVYQRSMWRSVGNTLVLGILIFFTVVFMFAALAVFSFLTF